jgi:pimeloyl-ACP methyl ester carboxylesterase
MYFINRTLFLHYGPGGNSFAEKEILGTLTDRINFWDQPKVKHTPTPFQSLALECERQTAKMTKPCNLIAHSFGCDLTASLLQKNPDSLSKIILISPLRHLPSAFINLGKNLLGKEETTGLKTILETTGANVDATSFWNLVTQVTSHPLYNSSFWQSQACMNHFSSLTSKAPEFDAEEWQTIIHNYIFSAPQTNFNIFKNSNVKVILGAEDPYLTPSDFQYWQELLGNENVSIIKNAGHFPHLEDPSSLLKFA